MTEDFRYGVTDPRGVYGRPATMTEDVARAICKRVGRHINPIISEAELSAMAANSYHEQHWMECARDALAVARSGLKAAEFRLGPSGGHGERSVPSVDELFDEALK